MALSSARHEDLLAELLWSAIEVTVCLCMPELCRLHPLSQVEPFVLSDLVAGQALH